MKLVIDKRAQRRLRRMPAKARTAMVERLKAISADPFAGHSNVRALRGEPNAFRLRQGDWRALYRVDRAAQEVRVYVIDTRARAYERCHRDHADRRDHGNRDASACRLSGAP